jgi:hypothetical protein
MKHSRLLIDSTFDDIFESWPNQTGEAQSKKAFIVALNNGADLNEIKKASEVYLLDNIGTDPEFIKNFGNFIREDVWKDYLSLGDKMLKKKSASIDVINAWNGACKSHWVKSSDVEAALPIAMKAMGDKSFRSNWLNALGKAQLIFKYELSSSDMKSKIILSLRWFCNTSPGKHTVMKIEDGEYGKAVRERTFSSKVEKIEPINTEARGEAANAFKQMINESLPDIKFRKRREAKTTSKPNEEIKQIANKILDQFGAGIQADGKSNEEEDNGEWFS